MLRRAVVRVGGGVRVDLLAVEGECVRVLAGQRDLDHRQLAGWLERTSGDLDRAGRGSGKGSGAGGLAAAHAATTSVMRTRAGRIGSRDPRVAAGASRGGEPSAGVLAVAAVVPLTFISHGDGSVVPGVGRVVSRSPATNDFPPFQLDLRAAQLRRDGEPIP